MKTYTVFVTKQGLPVAEHEVDAPDGGAACDLVEAMMGLTPPRMTVNGSGKLAVTGWHGNMFHAVPK